MPPKIKKAYGAMTRQVKKISAWRLTFWKMAGWKLMGNFLLGASLWLPLHIRYWKLRHEFFKGSDHVYVQFALGWLSLSLGSIMAIVHRSDWLRSLQAARIDQFLPVTGIFAGHQVWGFLLAVAGVLMIAPLYEWPVPKEESQHIHAERFERRWLQRLFWMLRAGVVLAEVLWAVAGLMTLADRFFQPIPIWAMFLSPPTFTGAFFVLVFWDLAKRVNSQYVAEYDRQERRARGIKLRAAPERHG